MDAADLALRDYIVTLGVKPDRPETGYGYIHCGDVISEAGLTYEIDYFTEKPDFETACNYLEEGGYLWNFYFKDLCMAGCHKKMFSADTV